MIPSAGTQTLDNFLCWSVAPLLWPAVNGPDDDDDAEEGEEEDYGDDEEE